MMSSNHLDVQTPTGRPRTHSHEKILHESSRQRAGSGSGEDEVMPLPLKAASPRNRPIGRLGDDRMAGLNQKLAARPKSNQLFSRFILREEHDTNLIFNKRVNLDRLLQKRPSRNTLMSLNVIQEDEQKKQEAEHTKVKLGNFLATRPTQQDVISRNIYKEREAAEKSSLEVARLKLEALLMKRPTPERIAEHHVLMGVGVGMLPPSEKLIQIDGDELVFKKITMLADDAVATVACGWAHSVFMSRGGQLYACGLGDNGRLGTTRDGSVAYSAQPILVEEAKTQGVVEKVSCGDNHSAVVIGGRCFTWGLGNWGRLGQGTQEDSMVPTALRIDDDGKVVDVACGGYHTLILLDSGRVLACGWNKDGRLGVGANVRAFMVPAPMPVHGLGDVEQVACGQDFSIALTADGRLYSWGQGIWGALGHDDLDNQDAPKRIEFFDDSKKVCRVAAGGFHCLALTADGELFSWGYNQYGQLGRGVPDRAMFALPARVDLSTASPDTVSALFCGKSSSFVCVDGKLYAWGWGVHGVLGTGDTQTHATPVAVHTDGVVVAGACGQSHTIIVIEDGSAHCTGERAHGRLGCADSNE